MTNSKTKTQTREEMKRYWEYHTQDGVSESAMMLMSNVNDIDSVERREIMSLLPSLDAKKVIELGAGVGRFTGKIANQCETLLAVDFIQASIDENARRHREIGNITFKCADVASLQLRDNSKDFIFSNWLMMYLNDDEVRSLAEKTYQCLSPGGYVFFRESCEGGPSGDKKRSFNPTFYRSLLFYTQLYNTLGFELILNKMLECYDVIKNKTNQYVWIFRKKQIPSGKLIVVRDSGLSKAKVKVTLHRTSLRTSAAKRQRQLKLRKQSIPSLAPRKTRSAKF